MATIQELYTQSTLSLAAYANLTTDPLNAPDQQKALMKAGMAEAQAIDFAAKWTVVAQESGILNNIPTGLSATVFADNAGTKYLAIRGTEFNVDLLIGIGLIGVGFQYVNPQYAELYICVKNWLSSGVLPNDKAFTVTGHSLGGYLAVA